MITAYSFLLDSHRDGIEVSYNAAGKNKEYIPISKKCICGVELVNSTYTFFMLCNFLEWNNVKLIFFRLLTNIRIQFRYPASGVISHLACDGPEAWKIREPKRDIVLTRMCKAIKRLVSFLFGGLFFGARRSFHISFRWSPSPLATFVFGNYKTNCFQRWIE